MRIKTQASVIFIMLFVFSSLSCGSKKEYIKEDGNGDGQEEIEWNNFEVDAEFHWDISSDDIISGEEDGKDGEEVETERCYEEGCFCFRGETVPCYEGGAGTQWVGFCRGGMRVCGNDGVFSACLGQVLPQEEICDGIDNDCDGQVDEGVANSCRRCDPPVVEEICGNGLDDNCNGLTDENCDCDPGCMCPEPPDPDAPCECHPPTNQPCYEGPPFTLGFGICKGGVHDCILEPDGSAHWSVCAGQVLPMLECVGGADGIDNDCDGMIDEGCTPDGDGDGYSREEDCDDNNPDIHPGKEEVCDGIDNNCNGLADEGVLNACGICGDVGAEVCGNGYDDDCDGQVDEGCSCQRGEVQTCYSGIPGTENNPPCMAGLQTCSDSEEFLRWGECEGEVTPTVEICDGVDNDCDGLIDERWALGSNRCGYCDSVERCDGVDNDCDGFIDEGVRNRCGDCLPVPEETECDGNDNDCDGLVDEGLLNSCGECPPAPCYEKDYPDPGECDDAGRNCNGTVPWPDDPTSITLGQSTLSNPFIYISVTGKNEVAKLSTETGAKIWQVPSWGTWPSRTAVALDGTVWVGNRGFNNTWSPDASNVVHLDADGNLICRADVVGLARGVAIDGDGNVWGGTWDGMTLWKIHGSAVDTTQNPPRCIILGSWNVGVNIYGLAVDGSGHVWTSSDTPSQNTIRFDIATNTWQAIYNPSRYGIAVSPVDGKIWIGGWSRSQAVHSIDPNPPYNVTFTSVGAGTITAVTVDHEGFVWGSGYGSNRVYKIDPVTGRELCSAPCPAPGVGGNPHGIAEDAAGKIWVPNRYGGYVNVFNRDCTLYATYPVDPGYENYTYSDMTGMQLRTVTVREGHWIQNYDSGYACPTWHSIVWRADVPPDTSVSITAVSADTEAGLTTSPSTPPCGPYTSSPADLLSCPQIQCHRWLQLDVRLTTTMDGVRPVVHEINAYWSY